MHYPDEPFIPGEFYAFRYPNFEESTDLRRMQFECLANRHGSLMIVGTDLDTGHESRWLPELMIDVEPYVPVLLPKTTIQCRHAGKTLSLHVYSVFPQVDGPDFKVTGVASGRHFAAWLSEIEILGMGVAK